MKSWEFPSKDDRTILVRHTVPSDAQDLFRGFSEVVSEGTWLPTLKVNSSVSDWVHWIERARYNDESLIIAEVDGKYAGHLTLQPEEWTASKHVAKLGIIVIHKYRGIGVGKSLMLAAESDAKESGFEKIILSTFHNNSKARTLYKSLGYREVGIREDHFKMPKGYIHEVLMEKRLDTE